MREHQQAAFVLLNRPYSESSWIVEIFSKNHGRLALMAKGARRIKSKLKGVLLPFQPLLLSWSGKGEIPTLTSAEIDQRQYNLIEHELSGDAMVCGFYCNELIVNLLHRYDPHQALFDQYQDTILSLNTVDQRNRTLSKLDWYAQQLREFEQTLIKESGYEISFRLEANGKTPIDSSLHYQFQPGQGFVRCPESQLKAVSGKTVLAALPDSVAAENEVLSMQDFSQGKLLMRDILNQTLGYKKVVSRDLFFPKSR